MSNEQRVSRAIIELADTLHEQFDVGAFLSRLAQLTVDLLGADGARVMLADNHDTLELVATSAPSGAPSDPLAESLAALPSPAAAHGPGPEAYSSGRPVTCPDLWSARSAWPADATAAHTTGLGSVYALPLAHRDQVIGAIEIYRAATGHYAETEAELARTLVHLATISILRERRRLHADTLARQLQQALDSRLVIEQAKGILAERTHLGVDEAFALMRGHARRHQMRLTTLAAQVVDGTYDTTRLLRTESHARRDGVATRRGGRTGAGVRASTGGDHHSRNGR